MASTSESTLAPATPARPSLWRRDLAWPAVLSAAVVVLPPIGLGVLITLVARTDLELWVRESGWTGWFVHALAFWILGLCLVPNNAWTALGGWSFGFVWGSVGAVIAYAGAITLANLIGSKLARGPVCALIDRDPKLAAVREALTSASARRTILLISLLRISPVMPFAINNLVLSSLGVPRSWFLIGSMAGMLPRTIAVAYLASSAAQLDLESARSVWLFVAGAVATVITMLLVGRVARNELRRQIAGPSRSNEPTQTSTSDE